MALRIAPIDTFVRIGVKETVANAAVERIESRVVAGTRLADILFRPNQITTIAFSDFQPINRKRVVRTEFAPVFRQMDSFLEKSFSKIAAKKILAVFHFRKGSACFFERIPVNIACWVEFCAANGELTMGQLWQVLTGRRSFIPKTWSLDVVWATLFRGRDFWTNRKRNALFGFQEKRRKAAFALVFDAV